MLTNRRVCSDLSELETEVIELFVRFAHALGLPKSVGQIYGLLFLSKEPLSMDQIVDRLQISLGSASQGLKQLRGIRAVKVVYNTTKRKDFFSAESEMRRVMAGFYAEAVEPQIKDARERFERLSELAAKETVDREYYEQRLEKLKRWHGLSSDLFETIVELMPPTS